MITKADKNAVRKRRHARVRKKVAGTPERPRLNVYRSNKHIYAQIIDDVNGVTLASASTVDNEFNLETTGNVEAATKVGQMVADRAKNNGVSTIVFDRGGYLYHGRVKALADAAREAGLEF
ncbi:MULTISPECIES: 50S ribosomal protein L18 [Pontibacillus]|uniref:Large ribosomal subunit protein uL18 n=1 Tax=Pontibacillus chungwhensis TaxID=265426 RepID=A0ABY8UX76_9BACI|nr:MULTISPECIES: 50S ribosomal protein L18 [Pontibacillus]MCD5326025.1 50S ribosomal protein L18 [Pontibacillus sp. HN14]WIF98271.1 50S ribosomal protein L18 [Pontibacillus chungwhensis]